MALGHHRFARTNIFVLVVQIPTDSIRLMPRLLFFSSGGVALLLLLVLVRRL